MKKIILSSISLAVLAILGNSCQKPEAEMPATTDGQTVLISVAAEDKATKATEADNVFLWEAGDKLDLITDMPNEAILKEGAGSNRATFEATGISGSPAYVFYPAGISTAEEGEDMISYPVSANNYTSGKITGLMLGAASMTNNNINAKLDHLCGFVEVNVSNMPAGINKMVFTAVSPKMTYHALLIVGGNYSAAEIVAGEDANAMIMPDVRGAYFDFTFNFEPVADGAEMKFFVPIAANSVFGADGFKLELFKGETMVEEKTFPLPAADYTVKRANILRGLKFEMKDAPVLEFAADYSGYSYNWMGGTFKAEDRKLSVNSNIAWTVSSNRSWARPAVNEEGKIVVTLDQNNAPGARKFTITVTPEDESLASLAKSVTMTETSGWSGGSGWTINDDGTATVTGTVSGNRNFNTYNVGAWSGNMAEMIWNFSEFNITAGNFHVEKYYDGWNMNLNLFADGKLALGVNGKSSNMNITSKNLNISDVKSIRILIDGYNNAWRVYVNNVECIWLSGVDKRGFDIPNANYWTGVQNTTGTVTIESFTARGWN